VYAWIGCADSFSPVAYNLIQNLATRISAEGMKLTKTTTAWIASQVSPSLEDGAFRALAELVDRPWFKRVWVIQEVVVSKEATVCCGNLKLPWTDFELTAAAVHGYLATIEKTVFAGLSDKSHPFESSVAVKRFEKLGKGCTRIRIMATSIRERLENKGSKTLNHIIQKFRSSESTDPRDKIYALLGIATGLDIEVSQIPVDYRQDVGDLCRSVTRCQLEYHKSLDILSDCSGDVNSERFSSWSICLQNSRPQGVIWQECGKEIVFRAGSGYKPCFSFGRTGRHLKVRGIYFDEIKQIGDICDHLPGKELNGEPYIPSNILMRWQNLVGIQVLSENSMEETPDAMRRLYFEQGFYPTGEPRASAFLHTITMDNTTNGDSTQFFDIELGVNLEYLDERNRENAKERQSRIKARIADTCMKRRFFCTSEGFYGLTAPNIKEGDKICIFFGCKTPSVVRREGGSYILLGDAYVEGLMRGEAVAAWKAGKLRSKVFSLQ
jgi:hypothetical protein